MNSKFISREGLATELGISKGVIQGWTRRHLVKGVHYVVLGRTTLFNRVAIEQWLDGNLEAQIEKDLGK